MRAAFQVIIINILLSWYMQFIEFSDICNAGISNGAIPINHVSATSTHASCSFSDISIGTSGAWCAEISKHRPIVKVNASNRMHRKILVNCARRQMMRINTSKSTCKDPPTSSVFSLAVDTASTNGWEASRFLTEWDLLGDCRST